MTKPTLEKLVAEQGELIRNLSLALRLLACHASNGRGELPPMHEADLRHIRKMLAVIGER